ncbi:MAG: DUF1080 domain-containing protein [Fuerstiella sp.]
MSHIDQKRLQCCGNRRDFSTSELLPILLLCACVIAAGHHALGAQPPADESTTQAATADSDAGAPAGTTQAGTTQATTAAQDAPAAAKKPPVPVQREVINLLEQELQKDWDQFSTRENVPLNEVWQVVQVDSERHLICRGNPKGFLFTRRQYTDFELTFDWLYPKDPNGNSGVLVYTQNEPRLWPTSIQVQLHQPQAGALFATGDATSDKLFDAGITGRPGEWNSCRIVSQNGRLTVEINGQKAGQTEGCRPASGHIALQSEGSETHFRRLRLTVPLAKEEQHNTAEQQPPVSQPDLPPTSEKS